jgi:hypothetical protein
MSKETDKKPVNQNQNQNRPPDPDPTLQSYMQKSLNPHKIEKRNKDTLNQ